MKSSYLVKLISLFLAEIIPAVTVPPKPKGLPIATAQSPTLALSESPKLTGLNWSLASIFKTAISIYGSAPITLALYSLSPTLTKISSAPEITWLFVTTIPFVSIINPDPKDDAFLSVGLSKSLNISPNGDPGGNWKGNWLVVVLTVWVVEILTTEGINWSAKSAKDSGTGFEFAKEKLKIIKIINILLSNFI